MTAQLDILYFAWVRERIGKDGESIAHPGAEVSVAELIALLAARGEGYAQAFAQPERVRAALDQHFVPLDALLGSGRELALFPPVTGG
jgi:molybdopterin synthase sulfur carrier subunit